MYRTLARLYKAADRHLLAKLPPVPQRCIKAAILWLAKRVIGHRLRGLRVDAFMFAAPVRYNGWKRPALPEWVRDEMRELSVQIDPLLHPDSTRSRSMAFHAVPYGNERPGAIYASLRQQVAGPVDTIFLVSSSPRGDEDHGLMHFVNALQATMHEPVLVVATEPEPSGRRPRPVAGYQYLTAGDALSVCSVGEREVILTRLLLQLSPRTIHLMDAPLGWQVLARYGKALGNMSWIYASLNEDCRYAEGYLDSYARRFLVDCVANLDGVITDDDSAQRRWTREMGIPRSLFTVVPYPAASVPRPDGASPGRPRVAAPRHSPDAHPDGSGFIQALQGIPNYLAPRKTCTRPFQ